VFDFTAIWLQFIFCFEEISNPAIFQPSHVNFGTLSAVTVSAFNEHFEQIQYKKSGQEEPTFSNEPVCVWVYACCLFSGKNN
jgi:hypothetical protein